MAIAKTLADNCTLRNLKLSTFDAYLSIKGDNDISDEGAEAIGNALVKNSWLESLLFGFYLLRDTYRAEPRWC